MNNLHKSISEQLNVQGIIMESTTVDFLEAVMDPFKAVGAARVPDYHKANTICMRDYIDSYIPEIPPITNTGPSAHYCLMLWSWGNTELGIALNTANATYNPVNNYYRVHYIFAGADGELHPNWAITIRGVNQSQILGMQSDGTCDYSGLAEAIRVFAGGLKVLPTIETITNNDAKAILNIWGGQLTPAEVYNTLGAVSPQQMGTKTFSRPASDDGSGWRSCTPYSRMEIKVDDDYKCGKDVRVSKILRTRRGVGFGALNTAGHVATLARNAKDVQEYPNAEGCTVRYNPFANEEQLEMFAVDRIAVASSGNRTTNVTDHILMPFILVQFTEGISLSDENPVSTYCRSFATFWAETELITPTPIYSEMSPVDYNYDKIRAIAGDTELFPTVTKGHSFKSFLQQAGKFSSRAIKMGKELYPVARRAGLVPQEIQDAVRIGNLAVRAINDSRKRRKKGKRKNRKGRNNKNVSSGYLLPGTQKPQRFSAMTPNV